MTTIYIPLLDEGTDVLRPTQGTKRDEDQYEVLATEDYDPEDENWKFPPGTVVRCKYENHEGEDLVVAVEKI